MSSSYTSSPPCASIGVLWDCFTYLQFKYSKIKISKNVILPTILHGCGNWSVALREENRARVSEKSAKENIWTNEG
jgi:hypothetical protein